MRRTVAALVASILLLEIPASAGIGSRTTMYVGGTLSIKEMTQGTSSAADEKVFVFAYKSGKEQVSLKIPIRKS